VKVLVIGFPLPNPQFDNYNLLTAPSWFDYDAAIVEPLAVSTVIEDVLNRREEYLTAAAEPIFNRPTNPLAVGLGDAVKRRRAETAQLLANGGVVVVFARPEVVHEGVSGFPGCDRYAFLPAPAGISYDAPFLLRAEGTEVQPVDGTHPFAAVLEKYRRWIAYRARFDENVPGFHEYGRVVARSTGGVAVGVDLQVGGGRVIFLPAFGSIAYGDQRFELAAAMQEALRRCATDRIESSPPRWITGYSLPGAEPLEAQERDAAAALAESESRLAEVRSNLQQITRYQSLLWQEGAFGLEPAVRDAFRGLGFEVERDPECPGWIADGSQKAFFEVEGSTETVLEYPYFHLQKRLQQDLIDTREPKHGLLVVNGQRLIAPESRPAPFSDTLRIAAENYRYGLLTTERLFELVRAVLERPHDTAMHSTLRSRLLSAVGEIVPEIVPPAEKPAIEEPATEEPAIHEPV